MFTRTFHPRQFLFQAYGSEPFLHYCHNRAIPFEQVPGWVMNDDDYPRWLAALAALPEGEQARVELELAQVNELAHPEAIAQLLAAAEERGLPSDAIPGDTALALWFFEHYPDLFHEVFIRQEITEVDAWRTASAKPDIVLEDLTNCQQALASSLKEFFRMREGTGRFCAVDAYRLATSYCFVVHLSDRLQLFEVFTEDGKHTARATRPAFAVLFVYYPGDGRVLLKTRRRAADKILDLFQRFGKAVLGIDLDGQCLTPLFRLDLFKRRFDPVPDAEDMEMARVKALHLLYPERTGRRRIKRETLSSDDQFAILDLLAEHGGNADVLEQLVVIFVELQFKLRMHGRSKSHVVRLWPDRCSLNQTPLGVRFHANLKRWGCYAI